jgi:DinB family protein
VVAHLNDCERLFGFRAFWFARGFDTALPSFDQNVAMTGAGADQRSWNSHIDEFRAVRAATLAFFQNLPGDAWDRHGIASDNPFSVRALAYMAAGHVVHHVAILKERYLSHVSG